MLKNISGQPKLKVHKPQRLRNLSMELNNAKEEILSESLKQTFVRIDICEIENNYENLPLGPRWSSLPLPEGRKSPNAASWFPKSETVKEQGVLLLTSSLGKNKDRESRAQYLAELDKLTRLEKSLRESWKMPVPKDPHCGLKK